MRHGIVWVARLLILGAAGLAGFIWLPPWLDYWRTPEGRTLERRISLGFLDGMKAAYVVFLIALAAASAALIVAQMMGRRRRLPRGIEPVRGRWLLLCASMVVSAFFLELGALSWHTWLHRASRLRRAGTQGRSADLVENRGAQDDDSEHPATLTRFGAKDGGPASGRPPLRILVIGESSGRGEPYHPWLSVGEIVGWQLERVFPGRRIDVDIWATGGATLASMHRRLAGLEYRPDALMVYAGHNEFQGRYAWMRDVDYYIDDAEPAGAPPVGLVSALFRYSPLCRLIDETREQQQLDIVPPRTVTRALVDRPVCTRAETSAIVAEFRQRLHDIARFCAELGACPIFVIPPSNDAGYDPSRSVLSQSTTRSERDAFARSVARASALRRNDRAERMRLLRELVDLHPEFAETHFRLARDLEQEGSWDEARRHYVLARERDAMPLRCPEPLRQVVRDVAAEHPAVLLVDGPLVLENKSPHQIVGDAFFHDAQHPNLRGYVALAEHILSQLEARRAFGWPASVTAPVPDTAACARHFKIDTARWAEICRREIWFFHSSAYIRYDPRFRIARAGQYERAAAALRAGQDPASVGVPGWPMPSQPPPSRRLVSSVSLR
jgi:hypothetical protein